MFFKKLALILAFFGFVVPALGGDAATTADVQARREGVPQIVSFNVTAKYFTRTDPLNPAHFRIFVDGVIFVPENTRVATKYQNSFRNSWISSETYGPYPKGQTLTYKRNWSVDAKAWNGKTFNVTLLASSTAGAVTRSDSVSLTRP